ncbi:hypothetical protein FNV43_RR03850 [Rhamnella rubrinervis]|uniref:Glycosyltransferase 61 catalytic domain-containing protein n=1 Tax=Rhamnella rubrinervis TaxID=2594499 RepID=A0A8K0MQ10_9ROSA|nr:hypothetical protein FNV43_RR03850 [Rhamnella rubrinervis]
MGKESKSPVFRASFIVCLLFAYGLIYAAFSSFHINPFEPWKHQESYVSGSVHNRKGHDASNFFIHEVKEALGIHLKRLVNKGEDPTQLDAKGFLCQSDMSSDGCLINKPLLIDKDSLTIYVPSDDDTQSKYMVKPYARKGEDTAMNNVSPVQILHGNRSNTSTTNLPTCNFNHNVPAVVFSSGGYAGSGFHEINEVIIPLFITSRQFESEVQLVISDYKPSWIKKHKKYLAHLSHYQVINMAESGGVRCFPGAIVGLKYHGNLGLNSSEVPGGYSMSDFRQFLREAYGLKVGNVGEFPMTERPRLLLISRTGTRRFLNEDELMKTMEEVGFEVVVAKPNMTKSLEYFSGLVNKCSVMVGVHGAGLTNEIFLPDGAVTIQVVPLGLDWGSTNYYGDPGIKMGLKYLDYKIEANESSLLSLYGPDHPYIKKHDPGSVYRMGYVMSRTIYQDQQSVRINLVRFRETLIQALNLIGRSTSTPPPYSN